MKGYKGFEKGLICRGKQYSENVIFEEKEAEICSAGMHFCQDPFEVLEHYGFLNDKAEFNDFAEVEALSEVKTNNNKKFCATKLKIGTKLSFAGFVKACVDFVIEKTTVDIGNDTKELQDSGDSAQIGSSGYSAQIDSSGEESVICCAGYNSMVKAKKGSWITLSEWKRNDKKGIFVPVCVKSEFVDGERIKADTWYKIENGEFVEVQDEN